MTAVSATAPRSYINTHSHTWTSTNQALVIVTIALGAIALALGSLIFLHTRGMPLLPIHVVGTIGEMGGGFLLAGGTSILLLDVAMVVTLTRRKREFQNDVDLVKSQLGDESITNERYIIKTIHPGGGKEIYVAILQKENKRHYHFFHKEQNAKDLTKLWLDHGFTPN